jgi:poly-gamma-glutamate capsule biosynthesis protein CapA/YwtB (metallophosphatase superfamily)
MTDASYVGHSIWKSLPHTTTIFSYAKACCRRPTVWCKGRNIVTGSGRTGSKSGRLKPNDRTSVALTGNTYLSQTVAAYTDPGFLQLVKLLRGSDVALANLECTVPDPEDPPAFVAGTGWSATYMPGTPAMLEDLKFMGIDGVCTANNHISDFGDSGILSTIRHLKAAGLPQAGIGGSLREAEQPAFLETRAGVRVAFLAASDWGPRASQGLNFPWPAGYFPSNDGPPFRPRPGVNLLRYDSVSHVSRQQVEELRRISEGLDWEQDKILRRNGFWRSHQLVGPTTNLGVEVDTDSSVYFLGRNFIADDVMANHTVMCQEDADRIYAQIRNARKKADLVFVALHDQSLGAELQDYVKDFAHGAIDAGADVYFSNGGIHEGIEIYKGKAVIFGQPSLFLQYDAVHDVPASSKARFGLPPETSTEEFVRLRLAAEMEALKLAGPGSGITLEPGGGSVVHVCNFDSKAQLSDIKIYPLERLAGPDVLPARRGLPMIAAPDGELCARILRHSVETSAALGTRVDVDGGVGLVRFG